MYSGCWVFLGHYYGGCEGQNATTIQKTQPGLTAVCVNVIIFNLLIFVHRDVFVFFVVASTKYPTGERMPHTPGDGRWGRTTITGRL